MDKRSIEDGEVMAHEAVNISPRGLIPMPTQFETMRELLVAIEEALLGNKFLRN